jgi:hypothetical protein
MFHRIETRDAATNGMTAKEAIKGRCLDCFGRKCADTRCALYGLMRPQQGAHRTMAIREYCRWCMHGTPVNQCASPECEIYKYRAQSGGTLHVRFLPLKSPIGGNGGTSKAKDVVRHVRGETPPQNAHSAKEAVS